jgi:membrane protease YdiL (CAAX protease family)
MTPLNGVVWACVASVLWCAAQGIGLRMTTIYPSLGVVALAIVFFTLTRVDEVRAMLRVRRPGAPVEIVVGLAVGVITLVLTHAGFVVLSVWHPSVVAEVERLYAVAAVTPISLGGVCLVIVAEELLWRGALPALIQRHMPPPAARTAARRRDVAAAGIAIGVAPFVLATLLYTAAQLGIGSGWLALAALMLGGLWAAAAHFTRSLLMPIASHAVWTLGVLGFWPLSIG